ncbi:hypothetical protein VVT58_15530 [Sphingobium sp. SJ10-10]|uniref:hypothetical protein n=1 Tax=Sphingobium sp. SJ10-10 TaxID=3114999 RepID=UPI002E16E9DE|nr:hypothetical protein [Sphingobium sp. SJ10-10]
MADGLGNSIFLKPDDVVRAFEARGALQPTVRWSEMMHENHAVAFTVAKIAKLDLLRSVQASIGDVIREGGTFEEWKSGILPELQRAGWWGAVSNRELTGTDETIIVNNRRLKTPNRWPCRQTPESWSCLKAFIASSAAISLRCLAGTRNLAQMPTGCFPTSSPTPL